MAQGLMLTVWLALATGVPVEDPTDPANLLFWDELEDGGLTVDDVPPGRWSGMDAVPGTDAGISTAAARSGNRGLRFTDFADLPAMGTTVATYASVDPSPGDRYARAWVRVVPTSDAGVFTTLQLLNGSRSACDINLAYPPGAFLLAGDTASGGYPVSGTGFVAGPSWHLVECGLVDAGTSAVTRVLWLDSREYARQQINQLGWTVNELDMGEPWSDDGQFQGVIDIDGVAVTASPPPSHVEVDAGLVGPDIGQCVPISGRLMSSSKVPSGALHPDRLTITVTGGAAATFVDPLCRDAGSSLDIDAGTVDVAFGVQALAPAVLTVYVDSSDLVGRPIGLDVVTPADAGAGDGGEDAGVTDAGEDGGTEPGGDAGADAGGDAGGDPVIDLPVQELSVCGCGSAGAPPGVLGVVALIALAFRPSSARRRRRPGHPRRGTSGRRSRTARCGG